MEKRYILTEKNIEEIIYRYLWDKTRPKISDLLKEYPKYLDYNEDYTLWEE